MTWIKRQTNGGELYHHGIKGQRWGRRNYQYEDGSLTPEGKERYSTSKNGGTHGSGAGFGSSSYTNSSSKKGTSYTSTSATTKKSESPNNKDHGVTSSGVQYTRVNKTTYTCVGGRTGREYTLSGVNPEWIDETSQKTLENTLENEVKKLEEEYLLDKTANEIAEGKRTQILTPTNKNDEWTAFGDTYEKVHAIRAEQTKLQRQEKAKEIISAPIEAVKSAYNAAKNAVSSVVSSIANQPVSVSKTSASVGGKKSTSAITKAANKVAIAVNKIGSALTSLFKKK